jgi:hypothetical protein
MKQNKLNEWIVLIGGMHLFLTKVFLSEFDEKNYNLLILDKAEMLELLSSEIFPSTTEFVAVDYNNESELLKKIDELRSSKNIRRAITFRELATLPTAIINAHLQLDWTSPDAVACLQNKYQYQQLLSTHELPVPKAMSIRSAKDLQKALKQQPFLLKSIIKPAIGLGSMDVYELPRQQKQAFKALESLTGDIDFILEEFLEGQQYSIDGICYDHKYVELAVCKKEMFANSFVASRQSIGVNLNEQVRAKIDVLLPKLLRKVGISHGFFHLQFWVLNNVITFGEIHNRPGGSFIGPASALHSGIRPFRALFSQQNFHDEIQNLKPLHNRECFCIEILKYPKSGVLHSVILPDLQPYNKQVVLTHFYNNFGNKITANLTTTFDYAGLIVTKGTTIADSITLAEEIKAETRFHIY